MRKRKRKYPPSINQVKYHCNSDAVEFLRRVRLQKQQEQELREMEDSFNCEQEEIDIALFYDERRIGL